MIKNLVMNMVLFKFDAHANRYIQNCLSYCELYALSISLKRQSSPTIGQLDSCSAVRFIEFGGEETHREVTEEAKQHKEITKSILTVTGDLFLTLLYYILKFISAGVSKKLSVSRNSGNIGICLL